MRRYLRVLALSLGLWGTPAEAQGQTSESPFAPIWTDTVPFASAGIEVSAWWFGVVVRTVNLDPGIATIEGDSVASAWVANGFEFFDALADGRSTPPFGWSSPASSDGPVPEQGLRLGLVPDPERGGALTLAFVVFRHASRRGYVFPVSEAEASRILGVVGEAATRVRAYRASLPAKDRRCEEMRPPRGAGPTYPETFRRLGIGGEVWAIVDLDETGRPTQGKSPVLWGSHPQFVDAVATWLPRAQWAWPKGVSCRGPGVAPFAFRMSRSLDQTNEGWIWVRRER